jgi:hypothetical protein
MLVSDRGDDPTIWLIGPIDAILWNAILDEATKFSGESDGKNTASLQMQVNRNSRNAQLVRFGLRGWRNFKDSSGNQISFSTVSTSVPSVGNRQGLSDQMLDRIVPYIAELADQIYKANSLDKEVRGN